MPLLFASEFWRIRLHPTYALKFEAGTTVATCLHFCNCRTLQCVIADPSKSRFWLFVSAPRWATLAAPQFMIFPMPPIWFGTPHDEKVARRIDRYEGSKLNRMLIGLHVANDFSKLSGALLVVSGHGKYLRISTWKSIESPVPDDLRERLQAIQNAETHNLTEMRAAQSELASHQSVLIQDLKESAGKYVDRILALSLTEPGLWRDDFDGRQIYFPLSLPAQLAELTGLNVIDALPNEDVESGGSGKQLELLPLWLAMADRDQRAATESRVVVMMAEATRVVFLPGSDGADVELPEVLSANVMGTEFVELVEQHFRKTMNPNDSREFQQLHRLVNGRANQTLLASWRSCLKKNESMSDSTTLSRMIEAILTLPEAPSYEDVMRSIVVFCADQVLEQIERFGKRLPLGKVSVCGDGAFSTLVLTELTNRKQNTDLQWLNRLSTDSLGDPAALQAVLAGMQGFLFIDQMPSSLPWITGCHTPRILGRVTKGRPVTWKQLLEEMADYRPPAMKLREAI